jgi:hypothetical protein
MGLMLISLSTARDKENDSKPSGIGPTRSGYLGPWKPAAKSQFCEGCTASVRPSMRALRFDA